MNSKTLLILGSLIFGLSGPANGQANRENQTQQAKEIVTMEEIKNVPEEFWRSGFVLNGCQISFPCKLIDLMQAGDYKSSTANSQIPPTGENEVWAVILTNGNGEKIEVSIFNPTAQKLDETDCIVNSICITPRSDNWHMISDFAIFGLKSKAATREEVVETLEKYCGAPAQVIDIPMVDYYEFYDTKPSETNPPHYDNIKIGITISKMDSIYKERMIGFEFKHAGDFYRKQHQK